MTVSRCCGAVFAALLWRGAHTYEHWPSRHKRWLEGGIFPLMYVRSHKIVVLDRGFKKILIPWGSFLHPPHDYDSVSGQDLPECWRDGWGSHTLGAVLTSEEKVWPLDSCHMRRSLVEETNGPKGQICGP